MAGVGDTQAALGRARGVELRSRIGLFKDEARRAVEARRDDLIDLSHRIRAKPELAFEEEKSAQWDQQPEFTTACEQPSADRAVIEDAMAMAMAWTALDIAADGAQRARLLDRSRGQTGPRGRRRAGGES